MAEWSDEIPQFSPYVSQQPVEAMAKIGFMREQQFEQGVQTVQNYYDSLLSLPLIKGKVQDYVKQKVGQLNSAVKQSISGDFSDRRLVNQIGGLASQISSDPIVKEGIESTARIQASLAKQKADQEANAKNGKNPVNNINDLNDQINAYLTDGQVNTSFNGNYTPYVDVVDRAIKLFKDQNPGDNISRDAFFIDAEGKTQVNPTIREGVDPSRIQSVLNLVYQQPDVQQQLAIDGRQTYKGFTPQIMSEKLTENTNSTLKTIEKTIQGLQLKLATDATVNAVATTNEINQLKALAVRTEQEYNENTKILLSENPDALKTKLVQQGITSNFMNAYSYEKMKKSPLWETTMESLKYELDLVKNGLEQEKFKFDKFEKDRRYSLDVQKEMRMLGKKVDADGNPIPDDVEAVSITGNVPESSGKLGSGTFGTLYENAQNDLNQGYFGVVFDIYNSKDSEAGDFNPIKREPATGKLILNVDPSGVSGYKSIAEAAAKYNGTLVTSRVDVALGKATTDVKNSFQKVAPQQQYVQALSVRKTELDAKKEILLEEVRASTGSANTDFVDAYIINNKLIGWESSQSRLKQKFGEDWEVGLGLKRIDAGRQGQAMRIAGSQDGAYQKFSKTFDASIAPKFQNLENEYKESQLQLFPIHTSLSAAKPEDKEKMRINYNNIASAYTSGNEAYGGFRDLLEPDNGGDFKNNIYGAVYDPLDRKYYLTVARGGESGNKVKRIEVTKAEFENASPALKSDNAFWNKFGDLLSITNKQTTDIPVNGKSGGFATAYQMERQADSKYQVGYHVVNSGNNLYNLKLYIKDKMGNDLLNTPAGLSASPAALMTAIKELESSDTYIDALLKQRK